MSEQFHVDPPALTGYGEQLQRNAGYVRSAHGYMSNEGSNTSEMEGLLAGIANGYKPLVTWQLGILDKMATGLDGTTGALGTAAELYRTRDKSAASQIDRTYEANKTTLPPK